MSTPRPPLSSLTRWVGNAVMLALAVGILLMGVGSVWSVYERRQERIGRLRAAAECRGWAAGVREVP